MIFSPEGMSMNQEYGQAPSSSAAGQQNQQGQNRGFQNNRPPFSGGGAFTNYHNILSESKMRLSGEKDPSVQYNKGMPPSLVPGREETNPRFTIYTNIEGKADPIVVRMDPIILEIVLDIIVEAANAEPGFRKQVVTKNFDAENKKTYDEARMTIGKHRDNGIVYIRVQSITMDDLPEINFTFAARSFLSVIQGDGVVISPDEFSSAYARAWANKVKRLYDVILATLPKKKKPFDPNQKPGQGNNGGGYQQNRFNNNGGNSNYQPKPQYQNNGNREQQPQQQQVQKPAYVQTTSDYPSLDEDDIA